MRTRNIVLIIALIIILMASATIIFFYTNSGTPVDYKININNSSDYKDSLKTPIKYKNYTKNHISFKCPVDWNDYLYDVNYGMTYSVDIKTHKQNSTAQMSKVADYSVAVGDPKTVGFKNMTVPTTMMVISKVDGKIDIYPKDYLAWKMIEGQINTTNHLKSDSSNYKFIKDSSRNFTIDGEKAYEYDFQAYSSYAGMEYTKIVSFETRNSTDYVVYTIMCSAREPRIANSSRAFDEMIKSIKINN